MIICFVDERYEIMKNVLSDDWVFLIIIKKNNLIEVLNVGLLMVIVVWGIYFYIMFIRVNI